MTPAAWRGRFAFGPWWLVYSGPVGPTQLHAHHAYQIVVHGGPPLVEQKNSEERPGPFVVIEPDVSHAFRRGCEAVLTVYIEPESSAGIAMRGRFGSGDLSEDQVVELVASLEHSSWARADELVHQVLSFAGVDGVSSPPGWWRHHAVSEALLRLPALVDEGTVNFTRLASAVGVSVSRLTHVFSNEVRIPLRSYARWLRLVTAVEHLADGATITQAAHAAHFSDAAHFSRVFKQMFGLAPSEVVGAGIWIR